MCFSGRIRQLVQLRGQSNCQNPQAGVFGTSDWHSIPEGCKNCQLKLGKSWVGCPSHKLMTERMLLAANGHVESKVNIWRSEHV